MALIFFEFPHDLDSLLDSLGVGLPLNLITLCAPHRYIILPLLERIFRQIRTVIIPKIRFEDAQNSKLSRLRQGLLLVVVGLILWSKGG